MSCFEIFVTPLLSVEDTHTWSLNMVTDDSCHPIERIKQCYSNLTVKGRCIADYIIDKPVKVLFMTVREMAHACGVSEATVVRFVDHLGYSGYGQFMKSLRDLVDTELTLLDRMELTDPNETEQSRFHRLVREEIEGLKEMAASMDPAQIDRLIAYLQKAKSIYVVGARLSYTLAYYMGWSLTKVVDKVRILKGSDSTCIDWLTMAPRGSLVIVFITPRYPNELIRAGMLAHNLGHDLVVVTDSTFCPLVNWADESLIIPSSNIPLFGSPAVVSCMINYIVQELAVVSGASATEHQKRLELIYSQENILFSSPQ